MRRSRNLSAETAAARPRFRLDLLRASLAFLIVLTICRLHQRYLVSLKPAQVLTGLAVFAILMDPRGLAERGWLKRWPARIIMGLALAALGSIVFGISQGGAFYYFRNYYWKVLFTSFLLMAAIRGVRDLWFFVWAYVVGTGILVWMAMFVYDMKVEYSGIARLTNTDTWDSNDICVLLLIGLAFCLLLMRTSRRTGKLVALTVSFGIGAVIARSGSRGGFLGLACLLLAYLFSLKGASKVRGVGIVALVSIGLLYAAPEGYWKQMKTITSAEQDYNWDASQGRRQLAIRGMQYMLAYPIFGIGVGNFGRAEGTISPLAGQQHVRWSAPHNSYVEAGAELGIPGFLLFLGLTVGCIVVPWRLRRRIPATWSVGTWEERFMFQLAVYLPIAAIGFAVPAFFVSFSYLDPIYILAALNGAFLAAVDSHLASAARTDTPNVRSAGRRSSNRVLRSGAPRSSGQGNSIYLPARHSPQLKGPSV